MTPTPLLVSLVVALGAALGVSLFVAGWLRWRRRTSLRRRVESLRTDWAADQTPVVLPTRTSNARARDLAARLGARVARRFPNQVGTLATRLDSAGLVGSVRPVELLGWKALAAASGLLVGAPFVLHFGAPGAVVLVAAVLVGWFGIDLILERVHEQRRHAILRDLPTVMDLLVLSLEAGMGLDRALRTVIEEYRTELSEEIRRVLHDVDLGLGRGAAFERMALRVGLDDLRSLSRAIVQSEELGVSLITVMHTQSREVRLSRRRAAEAEALRAPVKMLIPLVVFILPTLFMLLLGPVGLRAAAALSSIP